MSAFSTKYGYFSRTILAVVFLLLVFSLQAQNGLKTARSLYKQGAYCECIPEYTRYLNVYSDPVALMNRGRAYYYCHQLDKAIQDFNNAKLLNYDKADVDYYLAKSFHEKHEFESAILYYKQYLSNKTKDKYIRKRITAEIKKCANGINWQYLPVRDQIENMGAGLNSKEDEVKLVESPTSLDKYYLSRKEISNSGKHNILFILLNESNDQNVSYLNPDYLVEDERIEDVSETGEYLFFSRYLNEKSKDVLMVDRYIPDRAPLSQVSQFKGPVFYEKEDKDLCVINDSTFVFCSNRKGGYGGFDLYLTANRNGYWLVPVNLGSKINSEFDERSPFITKNGKALFFSSNNEASIGGFDIFSSSFDTTSMDWDEPENIGIPINSAGSELNFRLSVNGKYAFLASDRKSDGFGGFDIYRISFSRKYDNSRVESESKLLSQYSFNTAFPFSGISEIISSEPSRDLPQEESGIDDGPNFLEYTGLDSSKFEKSIDSDVEQIIERKSTTESKQISTFYTQSLFYSPEKSILERAVNLGFMEELTDFLLHNPGYEVILTGHCYPGSSKVEDLKIAMLETEKLPVLFEHKGIAKEKIRIRSGGSSFPIAKTAVSTRLEGATKKYNNRVDISLVSQDKSLAVIPEKDIFVVHHLRTNEWPLYKTVTDGLSYKLQVVQLKELANAPFLEVLPDCMTERKQNSDRYTCYSGIYEKYKQVSEAREYLMEHHQINAEIIPFFNDKFIEEKDMLEIAKDHVDLINFMDNRKK